MTTDQDLETRLWAIIDRNGPRPVPSGIEEAVSRICRELDRVKDFEQVWNARIAPQLDRLMARGTDFRIRPGADVLAGAIDELFRLHALINAPEILDFIKAVQLEAAHQRARWGSDHDAGKTDADWFWLIGYLAGKALHNPDKAGAKLHELKLHRIIAIAAAACN